MSSDDFTTPIESLRFMVEEMNRTGKPQAQAFHIAAWHAIVTVSVSGDGTAERIRDLMHRGGIPHGYRLPDNDIDQFWPRAKP